MSGEPRRGRSSAHWNAQRTNLSRHMVCDCELCHAVGHQLGNIREGVVCTSSGMRKSQSRRFKVEHTVPVTVTWQFWMDDIDGAKMRKGCAVYLHGLTRADLNDQHATVVTELDGSTGRVCVKLDSGQQLAVKPENLRTAQAQVASGAASAARLCENLLVDANLPAAAYLLVLCSQEVLERVAGSGRMQMQQAAVKFCSSALTYAAKVAQLGPNAALLCRRSDQGLFTNLVDMMEVLTLAKSIGAVRLCQSLDLVSAFAPPCGFPHFPRSHLTARRILRRDACCFTRTPRAHPHAARPRPLHAGLLHPLARTSGLAQGWLGGPLHLRRAGDRSARRVIPAAPQLRQHGRGEPR